MEKPTFKTLNRAQLALHMRELLTRLETKKRKGERFTEAQFDDMVGLLKEIEHRLHYGEILAAVKIARDVLKDRPAMLVEELYKIDSREVAR
jgi:uncharacterized protein (DUF111 family)